MRWHLTAVCPDCDTPLDAAVGPARCETCWRIVQLTYREDGVIYRKPHAWARLDPRLQGVATVVRALSSAYWLGIPQ